MSIQQVFIAGGGLMGGGIAYATSVNAETAVSVYDVSQSAIEASQTRYEKLLAKQVEKGKMTTEVADAARARIRFTTDLSEAAHADLVIEAAPENLDLKQTLFKQLDALCPSTTIFASNTSSLPITSIASVTERAERFVGMHFFSPVHIMTLLELIRGLETSDETYHTVKAFGEKLGKTVVTSNDFPGFITTRLGMVLLNEAMYALMEGVGTPEDIDMGMKLGFNHPMGPLALADAVGLDICLSAMTTLEKGFGNPKYAPCPLLKRLVQAGHLGKKTGRGFYSYT